MFKKLLKTKTFWASIIGAGTKIAGITLNNQALDQAADIFVFVACVCLRDTLSKDVIISDINAYAVKNSAPVDIPDYRSGN